MANSTDTLKEIGTELAPAPPGHEHGTLTAWIQDLIFTVDHKKLGFMYIGMGWLFFIAGGILASLIRLQLAVPNNHVLDPEAFNGAFTMHGTAMIFFFAMAMVFGLANYVVPLQIGARDMAFPRLNAFSFWTTFFGGCFLFTSYVAGPGLYGTGAAPDASWFALAPLTSRAFSPGNNIDYWSLGLLISGVGTITGGVNVMVTIFEAQAGGSPVLWQHFFWIFGHPEVYILVLPAFGVISEVIPVFSRKPIFGYPMMVAASVMIGFISAGVWAHHMFTIGMDSFSVTFFAFATFVIAIPTGIKIFNWLGTMYGGKLRMEIPMLFCIAFLFQFLIAGLTGIMLGCAPFDWQLNDSYFVIAHFHYVIVGGIVFGVFAGFYYWFPKATGRLLNTRLGLWHFWVFTIGFHLTFDPQHFLGILGMPRRIYTYQEGRGWEFLNMLSTIGAIIQGIGAIIFIINMIWSARKGKIAGDDPWDAWTLEWTTTSPPPEYNFEEIPEVRSRRPLWDLKHPEDPDWKFE